MTATVPAGGRGTGAESGKAGAAPEQAGGGTGRRMGGLHTETGAKVPVGKAAIWRLRSEERRKASHIWIGLTAAITVLAIVGGGVFYMHSRSVAKQLGCKIVVRRKNEPPVHERLCVCA